MYVSTMGDQGSMLNTTPKAQQSDREALLASIQHRDEAFR
jgi:hypothetical protein